MQDTSTIQDLAREAHAAFEPFHRGDDEQTLYRVKDSERGGWVTDLVMHAHGDDFLPDDWRYECIIDALGFIADTTADEDEWAHEFADGKVDVYTASRFAWLASNLRRQSYVDEARDEGLVNPTADIADLIGAGQYEEASEVFHAVREFLGQRLGEYDGDES